MSNPVVLTLTTSDPLHDYLQLYNAISAISVGGGLAAANTDYVINFSLSSGARTLQVSSSRWALTRYTGCSVRTRASSGGS